MTIPRSAEVVFLGNITGQDGKHMHTGPQGAPPSRSRTSRGHAEGTCSCAVAVDRYTDPSITPILHRSPRAPQTVAAAAQRSELWWFVHRSGPHHLPPMMFVANLRLLRRRSQVGSNGLSELGRLETIRHLSNRHKVVCRVGIAPVLLQSGTLPTLAGTGCRFEKDCLTAVSL